MRGASTLRCNNSLQVGSNLVIHGHNNTVKGTKNQVFGNGNIIIGDGARVYGDGNHIKGTDIYGRGNKNRLEGVDVVAEGNDNTLIGVNLKVLNDGSGNTMQDASSAARKREREEEQQAFMSSLLLVLAAEGVKDNKKIKSEYVQAPSEEECKHDTDQLDEGEPPCVICLTNKPICATIPCLHQVICVECARSLCGAASQVGQVKCPQCREVVDGIKRVFKG